jgi:metal-dependent HD superfamily phosphatase/phosphodiesterase
MSDRFEVTRKLSRPVARVFKNRGVVIELAASYRELEEQSLAAVEPLWAKYPKAQQLWETVVNDAEAQTDWDMANYMAVNKLGYNDHGMTHAIITSTNAVRIFDLLVEAGIKPDVQLSGAGDLDDACAVVTCATLLHDIGNQIHRQGHELLGVGLARNLLDRLMAELYPSVEQRIELRAFILNAIATHDFNPLPLTFEGGLVGVADGTDITKGRGRKAFDLGKIDIHSVSALAIDEVRIGSGKEFPVEITVYMNNSAGIFQIEDTLTKKVVRGPLAKWITITAVTRPEEGKTDARIIERLTLKNGVFVAE